MEGKAVSTTEAMIADFLAQRTIAVVGVSHEAAGVANTIYRKLGGAGYHVLPVNPGMDAFEGARCFARVSEIDEPVDGVMIVTSPSVTDSVVDECIALGIKRVWMHDMLGTSVRVGRGLAARMTSVSDEAVHRARAAGVTVISGDCPMQHVEPVDGFHRCIHWVAGALGNRN